MVIVITHNFISLETSFFLCYYKPLFSQDIFCILHGDSSGLSFDFEFKIQDSDSFISLGSYPIFWDLDRTPIQ